MLQHSAVQIGMQKAEKYYHGTKMEKLDSPETLIAIYQTARLHTPEYRRKALKIHNMWKLRLYLAQQARLRVKFLMLFYVDY